MQLDWMSKPAEEGEKRASHARSEREELRGVYMLGVVAIYATVRDLPLLSWAKIPPWSLVLAVVDGIMVLWAVTGFFMVFAVSEDIIGRNWASRTRKAAEEAFSLSAMWTVLLIYAVGIFGILYLVAATWDLFVSYPIETIFIAVILAVIFRNRVIAWVKEIGTWIRKQP
jgi:hypothetical protein